MCVWVKVDLYVLSRMLLVVMCMLFRCMWLFCWVGLKFFGILIEMFLWLCFNISMLLLVVINSSLVSLVFNMIFVLLLVILLVICI